MKKTLMIVLATMAVGTARAASAAAIEKAAPAAEAGNKGFDATLIESWPEKPKLIAYAMIEKYGKPDASSNRMLVWHDNGPWKRTIVYREEVEHLFPIEHTDFLEQTVAYKVPVDKVGELAKFDGSVIVDRTKGELSARCDKEENNRLALNLADEISRGKRSAADARDFFTRTVQMSMAGKSSDLMDDLKIKATTDGTGDPDSATDKK